MPAYRRSKKIVAQVGGETENGKNGGDGGQGDRIAPAQWKQDNQNRYQSASVARTVSARLRSESVWLMSEVGRATTAAQKDSNFRLEEKLRDTNNWRTELQNELDNVVGETEQLVETRNQLESAIDQTKRPLRVTTTCLLAREGRKAGDRVRDSVEVSLEKEVDMIRIQQGKMRDFLVQVNKQLGANQTSQARLELDLDNKDAALDIDHTCHNIHNNTADIQLHGGIERQRKGSGTTTWEKKSDRNVQDAQRTRAKSEKIRADVEHHLATAANAMLEAWNSSNQSFTARIGECSEAHSKLQAHFSLNLQEMYDLSRHIANIKSAIKAKQAPIKVAQTRLELRTHRPNGEAIKDMPQIRLTQEIAELQTHLAKLNSKLAEAEGALKMLRNTKRQLREDLNTKATSLVIDRQKCMAIRLNFPYHTRCVCTAAKDEENQDLELLGDEFGEEEEERTVKIKQIKRKSARKPRIRQTYYMKF